MKYTKIILCVVVVAIVAGVFVRMAPADDVVVVSGITSIDIVLSPHDAVYPIRMSEAEWRQGLDRFAYKVLREQGTERAFSNAMHKEARRGIYYSRATGQPLFSSEHKYDSGTGWPSFWRPISLDVVKYHADRGLFGLRIEVVDSSSGSHLGHVFNDGPAPTGLRYCLNAAALIFVPEGQRAPTIVQEYANTYL